MSTLPPRFPRHPEHRRPGHVRRACLAAVLAGLPALGFAALFVWGGAWLPNTNLGTTARVGITILMLGVWLGGLWAMRERLIRPLQTVANILSGLREGDYSFRARRDYSGDALDELLIEVNALVETMRHQRLGALEATALLRTVMAEIEVAVFAFDANACLRLVNRAGERLLAQPAERLLGRPAAELGLGDCLEGEAPRTVHTPFPGGAGRWRLQRQQFRQGGLPHTLLVIADLSRELREEETRAWQRLVRVLGHELNNSLAPVKSIAGSLESLLQREPLPADWRTDMRAGLQVIASRAEALNRFVGAYAQLARLPKPRLQPVELAPLIQRVAALETRVPVSVQPGPPCTVAADADQLEQALINLVRNGAEAVLEAGAVGGGVRAAWARAGGHVELTVEDDGTGLASTANLFVPFFTTKQKGSGIGLILCRQIVENHSGGLTLENRADARGCVARLRLPCAPAGASLAPAPGNPPAG
jgi:nitrogen fixation/metabolism regulation signal transduction histidine kinase